MDFEGGSYVLGLQKLAPQATFALDFRALHDSQKPDLHGTVIPVDAIGGQVHWSVIGSHDHTMIGRSEYVSQMHGIASTFACSNCCPNSYYDSYLTPGQMVFMVTGTAQYNAFERDQNCYGALLGAYNPSPMSWFTENSSIATVNTNGLAPGLSPGNTNVRRGMGIAVKLRK